jgi:hypothetical protein
MELFGCTELYVLYEEMTIKHEFLRMEGCHDDVISHGRFLTPENSGVKAWHLYVIFLMR